MNDVIGSIDDDYNSTGGNSTNHNNNNNNNNNNHNNSNHNNKHGNSTSSNTNNNSGNNNVASKLFVLTPAIVTALSSDTTTTNTPTTNTTNNTTNNTAKNTTDSPLPPVGTGSVRNYGVAGVGANSTDGQTNTSCGDELYVTVMTAYCFLRYRTVLHA